MSVKSKIILMVAVCTLSLAVLVVVGWRSCASMLATTENIVDAEFIPLVEEQIAPLLENEMLPVLNVDVPEIQAMNESIKLMLDADRDIYQALVAERSYITAEDDHAREAARKEHSDNAEQVHTRLHLAREGIKGEKAGGMLDQALDKYDTWLSASNRVLKLYDNPETQQEAILSSRSGEAAASFSVFRELLDVAKEQLEVDIKDEVAHLEVKKDKINEKGVVVSNSRDSVLGSVEKFRSVASKAIWTFVIIGGISTVATMILGYMISISILNPIKRLGEIAQSVSVASRRLAGAAEDLSNGAQQQASSLEETAASLEEITSTVQQNAESAQQACQLSGGSRNLAEKGGEVTENAVKGMTEIDSSSKKISAIISTVDEIAFQTNLLALNAAVEAARAGEQGRGFAVVASEVRSLAQRSANAAKQVKGLIEDSVSKVEAGSQFVTQSGDTLKEIVLSVKRVTDIVTEIAAASREQATGIEQVNIAVSRMDQVTQSNASQTADLSSTAESLAAQARELQEVVDQFNRAKGKSSKAAAPAASNQGASSAQYLPTQSKYPSGGYELEDSVERELATVGADSDSFGTFEEF